MLIGILQTGYAPDALRDKGDYPDMFARLLAGHGFRFRTYRVVDMEFPESPRDCDGWLITGSRHGAYEDLPFVKPLEQFIRDAFAAHVPVAGICFGHQIMAQALGGTVEKFPDGWSAGPTEYDFDGETLTMNAWHQDQVVTPPPDAHIIASSPFCRYAGFAYDDRGLSVQAHPEFEDGFVAGLIDTRGRGVVPDAVLDAARTRLGTALDSDRIADRIAAFFKQARP
ncbi:MAG: GMP synthase - Glutamine amidotransferase domain [Rhodobacteraceae bacterium HLUCCA12]|nr:MAG: GMP synthase - Glutamine amidotransferase domain [Rhodobacteraceae bacterium HLUCCA12]